MTLFRSTQAAIHGQKLSDHYSVLDSKPQIVRDSERTETPPCDVTDMCLISFITRHSRMQHILYVGSSLTHTHTHTNALEGKQEMCEKQADNELSPLQQM